MVERVRLWFRGGALQSRADESTDGILLAGSERQQKTRSARYREAVRLGREVERIQPLSAIYVGRRAAVCHAELFASAEHVASDCLLIQFGRCQGLRRWSASGFFNQYVHWNRNSPSIGVWTVYRERLI